MRKTLFLLIGLGLLWGCQSGVRTSTGLTQIENPSPGTASGVRLAVASGGRHSSRAAMEIFSKGGNAVDAAVAASFCLAVERPHSLGLGGGGFITLVLQGPNGGSYFLDFRESAPSKAHRRMYLDKKGKVIPKLSQIGALSVGIPGFVAGMHETHRRWGSLAWKELLKPAIRLAREGFSVYPTLAERIASELPLMAKHPYTAGLLKKSGLPLGVGDTLIQSDLAKTLEIISERGAIAFYEGELGRSMVGLIQKERGIISSADLKKYRVIQRPPLTADAFGTSIVTAPPPSAGGALLIQWSRVLSGFDRQLLTGTHYLHLLTETMKRGYADRSRFFGDPEFTREPWPSVITEEYATRVRQGIDRERATPSRLIRPGAPSSPEKGGTSQLSLIDDLGNAVAVTLSINDSFGARLAVPGTGIFLNNTMDDFSVLPGEPNVYGLIGGAANAIAPLKRPTSSMMPTIVLKNGSPILAIGGAGGSRITSSVAQVMLNLWLFYPADLYKSQAAARIHHQWLPDELELEKSGFDDKIRSELAKRGHAIVDPPYLAKVQAVHKNSESRVLTAVVDPRDDGAGASAK